MEFIDPRKRPSCPSNIWPGLAMRYELYSRQRLVLGGAAGPSGSSGFCPADQRPGPSPGRSGNQAELTQEEAVARRAQCQGLPRSTPNTARPRGWRWWWAGWLSNQHQRLQEVMTIIFSEGRQMKVELLNWTPEPENTVAAAARLCYSDAEIAQLTGGCRAGRDLVKRLVEMGHLSPWSMSALPLA